MHGLFATPPANTPTGRRILINGVRPPIEYRDDPFCNPIALITQHTTFLSDLPVHEFLTTHARIRTAVGSQIDGMLECTLGFANQLTGEPIQVNSRMTQLSRHIGRCLCTSLHATGQQNRESKRVQLLQQAHQRRLVGDWAAQRGDNWRVRFLLGCKRETMKPI